MTYATGAFSGADDFDAVHAHLSSFATADGWTINSGTYPSLSISKGTTHVNLTFTTTTTVDDTLNTGASVTDYRIVGYLADSYPAGTYADHSLSSDPMVSNDWKGPYGNYWLFSGNGTTDPNYIYMVVQKANGRFCCVMLGGLDKKGVTYDGGDFLTGVFWGWWFAVSSASFFSFSNSTAGSDITSATHGFPGDFNSQYNVRLGDANVTHPFTSHKAGGGTLVPYTYGLEPSLNRANLTTRAPNTLESYDGLGYIWHGHIYFLGPNPINGVTPMFEVPLHYIDGYHGGRLMTLGSLPNYRACSMIGRNEAEEVSFGSDNWMVFPIKRYLPWNPEPFPTKTNTSGPYGHAFKIVP